MRLPIAKHSRSNPHGTTPRTGTAPQPFESRKSSLSVTTLTRTAPSPRHERSVSNIQPQRPTDAADLKAHARSPTMPNMPLYASESRPAPDLKIKLDGVTEDFMDEYYYGAEDDAPRDTSRQSKPSPRAVDSLLSLAGIRHDPRMAPSRRLPHSRCPQQIPRGTNKGICLPRRNPMDWTFQLPTRYLRTSTYPEHHFSRHRPK